MGIHMIELKVLHYSLHIHIQIHIHMYIHTTCNVSPKKFLKRKYLYNLFSRSELEKNEVEHDNIYLIFSRSL